MRRTADLSEVLPALTTGAGNWNVLLMNKATRSYEQLCCFEVCAQKRTVRRIDEELW